MISVQTTLSLPGEAMQRGARTAMRQALAAALAKRRNLLPRHFTVRARRLYDHQGRTPGYQRHKRRRLGRAVDLVYSGDLERRVLHQSRIRAVVGSRGARGQLIYHGARVLNLRHRPGMPDMLAELNTDTPSDQDRMYRAAETALARKLNSALRRGGRPRRV